MTPREPAYRVPFALERLPELNLYRLTNTSDEPVIGATLTLHGSGLMATSSPRSLAPNETMEAHIAGRDLAVNAILVVRWFRPNGTEFLWRISF